MPSALTPAQRTQMLKDFREQASDEMQFDIHYEGGMPDRTFSLDALDTLVETMRLFVGGRVQHRWHSTKEAPTMLRVRLTVEAR